MVIGLKNVLTMSAYNFFFAKIYEMLGKKIFNDIYLILSVFLFIFHFKNRLKFIKQIVCSWMTKSSFSTPRHQP